MRRLMLDMSQEKLASALGITFQQVQKYEAGTNRISASRLQIITNTLGVPVSFFFEGAPNMAGGPSESNSPHIDYVTEFTATPEGLALIRAFSKIKDVRLKRRFIDLVEVLTA